MLSFKNLECLRSATSQTKMSFRCNQIENLKTSKGKSIMKKLNIGWYQI